MALFDLNRPLDDLELKLISEQLGPYESVMLSTSSIFCSGAPFLMQYNMFCGDGEAASQMLYAWHHNQDPAEERSLLMLALKESSLDSLAEQVRMGECQRTVPQDLRPLPLEPYNNHQHLTSGPCFPNVDDLEGFLYTTDKKAEYRQGTRNFQPSSAPQSQCPSTHTHNQTPAGHETYTPGALQPSSAPHPSCPRKQTHTQTPAGHETYTPGALRPSSAPQPFRQIKRTMHTQTPAGYDNYTLGTFQPSSAPHPSRPSKRTHTQTPAGHETYTPGALQPSSAPQPFHPIKRTMHTQTPAGHDTYTPGVLQPSSEPYLSHPSKRPIPKLPQGMIPIPLESFKHHQHPTPPAPTYQPLANPPQQPHRAPMRTSHEITEIKLRDVSIMLGAEWKGVGTYLGFCNSQIEVMQEEHRVVKECIFQMLLQWRNTNSVEATKEKLKKALRRSLREDLADFIDKADD